jgi:hypothetical protein
MHTWAIIILLILASSVEAQELPSEVDLRAAYCVPIVKYWINVFKPMATDPVMQEAGLHQDIVEILTKYNEKLRRLRLYLLPRFEHLESLGMTAALKRGQEDLEKLEQYSTTCKAKCSPIARKSASSEEVCMKKCHAENPLKPRLDACSDLRWLPF